MIIYAFMPKYLIWLNRTFPFLHIRKGRKVSDITN